MITRERERESDEQRLKSGGNDIPPVQNTTLPCSKSFLNVSVESPSGAGDGLMLLILVMFVLVQIYKS